MGDDWIKEAVDHIVSIAPGSEIAMNCLRMLRSKKAVIYAYQIYRNSAGNKAAQAVWLIKHIAHPISKEWVPEFLNDKNVIGWGLGVLDQLLWTEQIQFDESIQSLFDLAIKNSKGQLQEQVDFIKEYLDQREKNYR